VKRGVLRIVVFGVVCFVAGTQVPVEKIEGSPLPRRVYYQVDYMKAKPGGNYLQMERELWKPVHQEQLKMGKILSWAVTTPWQSPSAQDYTHVVVTVYPTLQQAESVNYSELFKKVMPNMNSSEISKRTSAARDIVRSEFLVVLDEAP
jgi:hypothetical protein